MEDVIENCQTTFEEDGVNPQILDDLRKVGHRFLSPASIRRWHSFANFIVTKHLDIIISSSVAHVHGVCGVVINSFAWRRPSADIPTFGGAQAGRKIMGGAEHLTYF